MNPPKVKELFECQNECQTPESKESAYYVDGTKDKMDVCQSIKMEKICLMLTKLIQ